MYYGQPTQMRRMRRFYSEFIRPGDLVFDIGAHVGSRTMVWSRMGARVVAVEPLPQAVRTLRILFGRSPRVKVVPAAVGAEAGSLPMLVSEREPTVSTLSPAWADRMRSERTAFATTRWERSITVPVVTLDQLIAEYGAPAFCKIDTEGYDLQVLLGLSHPIRALSFEYVPPAFDLVRPCMQRLSELREYAYNWSVGESMQLQSTTWVDAPTLVDHLQRFPSQGNPGDIYARAAEWTELAQSSAPKR
jgi:FkbM family methyltransferase